MTIGRVFPTENDVGGLSKGRAYSEANLKNLISKLSLKNFIVSGFTVTNPSGRTIRVASGVAWINGYIVEETQATTDFTATASAAGWHLWIVLRDTDSDGLVDDFIYQSTENDTPPSGSTIVGTCLLCVVETDASSVTKFHQWHASGPGLVTGFYKGNLTDNRLITLPFNPRYVIIARDKIIAESGPGLVYADGFTFPTNGTSQVGRVSYAIGTNWTTKSSTSRSDRPQLVNGGFYVSDSGATGDESLNDNNLIYPFAAWA